MRRLLLILLWLLLLGGCNKEPADAEGGEQAADAAEPAPEPKPDLPRKRLLAVFSGTETDQWTSAMIGSLATQLHFDAWAKQDADDYFDYLGDYDVKSDNLPLDLKIVLTGMDSTAGLERQTAATQQLLELADTWKPDLVWLDGDPLQFAAGRKLLDSGRQVVFTGLTHDSSLYYEAEDQAAGFFRRHSVSGLFGRIWRDNKQAKFHCIVTDDSPEGRRRLQDFTDAEELLGEGSTLHVLPVIKSWADLEEQIGKLPPEADDLIITSAGEPGCSPALLEPPPQDILARCTVPVYVLGPGVLDMQGCTSATIKPAAQVHELLTVLAANLGKEIPMVSIPSIVPDDMQFNVSETELSAAPEPTEQP